MKYKIFTKAYEGLKQNLRYIFLLLNMSLLLLFRPRKGVTGAFDITPGKQEGKETKKEEKKEKAKDAWKSPIIEKMEKELVEKVKRDRREELRKKHLNILHTYLMMEGDDD